jgi:uncharacterized protein YqjF (DUF2071 family)
MKPQRSYPPIPFLIARWKNLILINYEVPPTVLEPFVPQGTELDLYQGKAFVSLVGFWFEKTRLFGFIPLGPFSDFEEFNLRFYIKRKEGKENRRAVCFVKEIVPFSFIAWTARTFYNEPYEKWPMRHTETQGKAF